MAFKAGLNVLLGCHFSEARKLLAAADAGNDAEVAEILSINPQLACFGGFSSAKSPLHRAAMAGHLGVCQAILEPLKQRALLEEAHATTLSKHSPSRPPRLRAWRPSSAASSARRSRWQRLLRQLLDQRTQGGMTALLLACQAGHAHVAAYLLRSGANALACDWVNLRTALHLCAQGGHVECVRLLCSPALLVERSGRAVGAFGAAPDAGLGQARRVGSAGARATVSMSAAADVEADEAGIQASDRLDAALSAPARTLQRAADALRGRGASPGPRAPSPAPPAVVAVPAAAALRTLPPLPSLSRHATQASASAQAPVAPARAPRQAPDSGAACVLRDVVLEDVSVRSSRFVDLRALGGLTALHFAAVTGSVECVQALLEGGASTMARTDGEAFVGSEYLVPGSTPLHVAALVESAAVAHALLQGHAALVAAVEGRGSARDGRGRRAWEGSSLTDVRSVRNAARRLAYHVARARRAREVQALVDPRVALDAALDAARDARCGIGAKRLSSICALALRARMLSWLEARQREAEEGKAPGAEEGAGAEGARARPAPPAPSAPAPAPPTPAALPSFSQQLSPAVTVVRASSSSAMLGLLGALSLRVRSSSDEPGGPGDLARLAGLDSPAGEAGGEPPSPLDSAPGTPPSAGRASSCKAAGDEFLAAGGPSLNSCAAGSSCCADDAECGVCLDGPVQVAGVDCRHALCFECAKRLTQAAGGPPHCPFCRRAVVGFVLVEA